MGELALLSEEIDMRSVIIVSTLALLAGCSSTPQTPQEKVVDTSPSWYLTPPTDDGMIYAAGMSTSPDLQFAVDKALLQAKSGLADRVKGETSVVSRSHVAQSGASVNRADDKTVKNIAKDVPLGGYEMIKSVVQPDVGTYRVYVLLRYTPTASDLDKSVAMLEAQVPAAKPAGAATVAPTPAVSAPTVSIVIPNAVMPAAAAASDEPPPPAADPRVSVSKE